MKLVQYVLISVILYLSTKVLAQEESFEHFKIVDKEKLHSLYGDVFVGLKSSDIELKDDNALYRSILNEYSNTYESIGQRQAANVLNDRNISVFGGLNNIGIKYSKDFLDFSIIAGRTVAPDLFSDDKWIVTDEFTIDINASKLLSNLKDQGVVDFSEKQYAAFAGVSFKRTFRSVHFADSYASGLTMHFDKLFLSFQKFTNKEYLNLSEYEFLQKEDFISLKAGAIAGAPIYGPIVGSAGVLASYESLSRVDIQAVHDNEKTSAHEKLRISMEKTKSASVGISASIGLEFLKLLRMTLLKYDFTYELEDSKKTYLSFYEQDYERLKKDSYYAAQVDRILKFRKSDLYVLKDNIVSLEQRKTEKKESKYSLLFWGGQKEASTQQIEIVKEGSVHRFFKHYFEKIKYKQNIFSRLVSVLVKSLLKLDTVINKDSSDSKKVIVEYSADENLIESKGDVDMKTEEKVSIGFSHNFFTSSTQGRTKKSQKKVALEILNNYSGVDPLAIKLFERDQIVGPVKINGDYKINRDGLNYLLSFKQSDLKNRYYSMCGAKSKGIFKWFRNLFNNCLHKMNNSSKKFYTEWALNDFTGDLYTYCKNKTKKYRFFKRSRKRRKCMEEYSYRNNPSDLAQVPLWRLKDIIQTIYLEHKNKTQILSFFGHNNVFYYGNFQAKTSSGSPFVSYFNEGRFDGLGVVDNFRRENNLRSPASLD
ncbi:hypothetical protein BIY24_06785 [Halobacteriovorax marinus]|uniref:hypothetical protein n=1 Tax=Halobacteriovorax marinus TaxID=97084 RepID=UPI000BC32388|nr:hypothetical protein [Halobacteriovorax marinus]ATH07659.1 hypothetical protein BIY24_06785 [Halobacteriovorax marinus]